jgi:hypothetical protein
LQTGYIQASKRVYTHILNLDLKNKKKIFFYIYVRFLTITDNDVMKPVLHQYPDKNKNIKIQKLILQEYKLSNNTYLIINRLRHLLLKRPRDHPLLYYG